MYTCMKIEERDLQHNMSLSNILSHNPIFCTRDKEFSFRHIHSIKYKKLAGHLANYAIPMKCPCSAVRVSENHVLTGNLHALKLPEISCQSDTEF